MKALPVKECTQGNGVNIRNNEMQEILKVGVIPSILYALPRSSADNEGCE